MNRVTFFWLVEPRIQWQKTNMQCPVSEEERVTITICLIANTVSCRLVREQFGVVRLTIVGIIVEVCWVMEAEFLHSVVRLGPLVKPHKGKPAGCLCGIDPYWNLETVLLNTQDTVHT